MDLVDKIAFVAIGVVLAIIALWTIAGLVGAF